MVGWVDFLILVWVLFLFCWDGVFRLLSECVLGVTLVLIVLFFVFVIFCLFCGVSCGKGCICCDWA